MSNALTRPSRLKPEIRLVQVISQFEADLSNQEKSVFRTLRSQSLSTALGPNDFIWLATELDDRISAKFSSRCFGSRFINFLQGVQRFAALGDVIVGGSQNLIACGVWSLVRMSLMSIVNISTYIEKLSSLFMAIGRATPRYQAIAQLYPRSKQLQSYLIEYLISVVELCHYLHNFTKKSTFLQITSSLSDSRLNTFQTDLEKWKNEMQEEMNLVEAQKNSGFRALAKSFFKSSSGQQDHATRTHVLDFCSRYDHVTTWKQIRKSGTASFHTRCTEYQEWKNSLYPSTLVYTGKLGSGKSVLLASIVANLCFSSEEQQDPVAYFFCKHDVSESLQARTIIGSLIHQLLDTISDISALAIHCESTRANDDIEKLLELLFLGFPSHRKAYLVLDGLDECNFEEKHILIQAVRRIQHKLEVFLCVSFRDEPHNGLKTIISQLLFNHIVSLPDNNPDIGAFIKADLKRCLQQKLLRIGHPALILEIEDALLKGSQGMFLWVALQMQTLCSMKTDHAIREALENLPKDLSETFARILQKSGSSDPSLQAKTLHLVLAAYRPLTTDELREALSVTPGDTTWDPSRIINDVYSALSCCGCLVVVDEEESTVRVVHHSFKQYVLNELGNEKYSKFSLGKMQQTMADTVVTYLNYDVFKTEISRAKATPLMAQSAPSKIMQVATQSSSIVSALAMKLLKSERQHEFNISKTLVEAQSNFKFKEYHPFKFYAYAEQYWGDHIYHVSGHNKAIFKLSSKIIHNRPYKLNEVLQDLYAILRCADQQGNGDIVKLLLTRAKNIDFNAKDSQGKTLLNWAVFDGCKSVVEMLIGTGNVDLNTKDDYERTPLITAVLREHTGIVELLLRSGKVEIDAKDEDGWTALMHAASAGYRDISKLLLTTGRADVNSKEDDFGHTALTLAAEKGYGDIVELLLATGKADVNIRGRDGDTALIYVVRRGSRSMTDMLALNHKADVCLTNDEGKSALSIAKGMRRSDIVEALEVRG